MSYQAPPGVFDIVPEDKKDPWKDSSRWQYIEEVCRKCAEDFGFREIRTPIFERTELFTRSVGETSDIVTKEMYTFQDKGERSLTLRPEGTAPVVRAVIENHLFQEGHSEKFYYFGPMFRYERMQTGRFRQFHHFGVEAFGNGSPEQDAEIIDLAYTIYQRLGVRGLKVSLSSLGDKFSRVAYKKALLDYLRGHLNDLSEDSRTRFEHNPLRVLDSKDETDKKIVAHAPSLLAYLDGPCREHFENVQALLKELEIPYQIDDRLVRGLDYYQKTVFEIISEDLGAQNTILGGGRYDGLVKELGGPDVPSIGFGAGIERALLVMLKQNLYFPPKKAPYLYLIPLGTEAMNWAMKTAHQLRNQGMSCEVDMEGRKVGKAFARAAESGATWASAVGEREIASGQIEIKELSTQAKTTIPMTSLLRILQLEKEGGPFLTQLEKMIHPFQNEVEKAFFARRIQKNIDATLRLSEHLKTAMTSLKDYLE